MQMIAGPLACAFLLLIGWSLGAPAIYAFFMSLTMGSTAIVNLGGTSIPAFVGLGMLLLGITVLNRNFLRDLGHVVRTQPLILLLCMLILYSVATAFILPRLFLGDTYVFVVMGGKIPRVPLAPVSGNINQSIYFVFNGLMLATMAVLLKRGQQAELRKGFVVWAAANALLGLIDVVGKSVGLGDLLAPIRTANYADLTSHAMENFVRINGGFPEASAYANAALGAFAFAFMDWRTSQSRISLAATLVLGTLLILSTSSTAYAGLAILAAFYALSVTYSALQGQFHKSQIIMIAAGWTAVTVLLGLYLYNDRLFDPLVRMILDATVNKTTSASALERGMWNMQSIQNVFDTSGIGVGLGSTRSSSWPVSVVAQLGIVGAVGFAIALLVLVAGVLRMASGREIDALAGAVSAAALISAIASSFGGGGADPGPIFFMALAFVSASFAARNEDAKAGAKETARREPYRQASV